MYDTGDASGVQVFKSYNYLIICLFCEFLKQILMHKDMRSSILTAVYAVLYILIVSKKIY